MLLEPYGSCLLILLIPFNHEPPNLIGAVKQEQHMLSYCVCVCVYKRELQAGWEKEMKENAITRLWKLSVKVAVKGLTKCNTHQWTFSNEHILVNHVFSLSGFCQTQLDHLLPGCVGRQQLVLSNRRRRSRARLNILMVASSQADCVRDAQWILCVRIPCS